jgi:hypothetical protein
MFLDSVFETIVAFLAASAFSLTVLAMFTASILRLLARQRALEYRMAERIALVRRGLHPHTLQPLPASDSLEPGTLTVARPS